MTRLPVPLLLIGAGAVLWYLSRQGGSGILTPPTIGGDAQQAVDLAKQHVASEQGIDPSTLQLVSVQQIQTDQSLGCSLPGYVYNSSESQNTAAWKVNLKSGVHYFDVRVRADLQVITTCPYG